MVFSGEKNYKYFIGYRDNNYKVKPFSITLPKISTYVKHDGQTKWRHFLIEDGELLEKYNDVWNKVSNSVKKEFDTKPIYNKKFLKTKKKSYGVETTDFYDKEMPKVGLYYICIAVIFIDYVFRKDKRLLSIDINEYKYIEKEKTVIRRITDSLKFFQDKSEEK